MPDEKLDDLVAQLTRERDEWEKAAQKWEFRCQILYDELATLRADLARVTAARAEVERLRGDRECPHCRLRTGDVEPEDIDYCPPAAAGGRVMTVEVEQFQGQSEGVQRIAKERTRQMTEEERTSEHDDKHRDGDMECPVCGDPMDEVVAPPGVRRWVCAYCGEIYSVPYQTLDDKPSEEKS